MSHVLHELNPQSPMERRKDPPPTVSDTIRAQPYKNHLGPPCQIWRGVCGWVLMHLGGTTGMGDGMWEATASFH